MDTGLAAPSQWDLTADKMTLQESQPLQVARCTKIINPGTENAQYVINVKQLAKFVVVRTCTLKVCTDLAALMHIFSSVFVRVLVKRSPRQTSRRVCVLGASGNKNVLAETLLLYSRFVCSHTVSLLLSCNLCVLPSASIVRSTAFNCPCRLESTLAFP